MTVRDIIEAAKRCDEYRGECEKGCPGRTDDMACWHYRLRNGNEKHALATHIALMEAVVTAAVARFGCQGPLDFEAGSKEAINAAVDALTTYRAERGLDT